MPERRGGALVSIDQRRPRSKQVTNDSPSEFVEQGADGDEPGRTAYAFSQDKLPPTGENLEWKAVLSFNAADEVMRDPGLKDLFMKAIEEGCAIAAPPPSAD